MIEGDRDPSVAPDIVIETVASANCIRSPPDSVDRLEWRPVRAQSGTRRRAGSFVQSAGT